MEYLVHVANLCFLGSYLVRDILWLRLLAVIAGFALGPYYLWGTAEPLYGPSVWNVVFMGINAVQIGRLLLERRPVRLSAPERKLYDAVFGDLGLHDFARLMKLARWRDAGVDTCLVEQGQPLDALRLICDGEVAVRVGEREVARLRDGRFVGEMSYLTRQATSASVWAVRPTVYVAWPCDGLNALLQAHPAVRAGLQLVLGSDLASKLRAA